jgi:hypothetical protein
MPLTLDGGKSSNIHWARYDPDKEQLEIDFKNNAGVKVSTYRYDGFKWEDWAAFKASESKGKYFAYKIRPKFRGVKLWNYIHDYPERY